MLSDYDSWEGSGMIVGIDIGGTKALCLAVDEQTGETLATAKASSRGAGPELLATLIDLVGQVETLTGERATSVGLGVAGLVTRGGVVRYSPNLPDIVEYPIGPELEAALGVPVACGNDATAGTWAEHRLGAGAGCDDMLFVALGTGIGMGLVAHGQVIMGANGFSGEAGHMVVDVDGPAHITGQRGPWEYFASGNALGRLAREAAADGRFDYGLHMAGSADAVTGFHVSHGVREASPEAQTILEEFCDHVAVGLANLVLILDPEMVVIAGGVSDLGEPLRVGIEAALHRRTLGADHRPAVRVAMATMGSDACAIGASLMAQASVTQS